MCLVLPLLRHPFHRIGLFQSVKSNAIGDEYNLFNFEMYKSEQGTE
jgi:hypothetical protein